MSPVGFEPTVSAGERPQTYALNRAATGTGIEVKLLIYCCPGGKKKKKLPVHYPPHQHQKFKSALS